MNKRGTALLTALMLLSTPLLAEQQSSRHWGSGQPPASQQGADVVVDMPPEVWSQGQNNNQPNCLRCCLFGNQQYTEGAVVKSEGVLLQCARDEKSLGTNNLIWKMVQKQ